MKHFLNSALYQIKQAYLSLKQKPGFVFSVVTTMGVTLGALLCVLTLAYVMLIKPLPYPDQDRLYVVESKINGNERAPKMSMYPYPAFIDLYKQQTLFLASGIVVYESGNISSIASQPRVNTAFVSPNFLTLLDMPIIVGRSFEASEALNTNNPVAIISFDTWQNSYNQQADILTKSITVGGISYRIVGVSAQHFVEPTLYEVGRKTHVWLPWDFNGVSERGRQSWGNFAPNMQLLVKLNPSHNVRQTEQLLSPLLNDRWQQEIVGNPRFKGMNLSLNMKPLVEVVAGDNDLNTLLLLAGVVGLVVIAFTNTSHLFIARTAEQQQKIAVKVALGVSKKQLFIEIFTQVFSLMTLALFFALLLANAGFTLMRQYLSDLFNRVEELQLLLIPSVIVFVLLLILSLLMVSFIARSINFEQVNKKINRSNKGQGTSISKLFQHIVVTSQVLITVVVIFANILLFKASLSELNQSSGFQTANIQRLVVAYNGSERLNSTERQAILLSLKQTLSQLPEVIDISHGASPLSHFSGRPFTLAANEASLTLRQSYVDNHYFSLIEQPLITGRDFTASDIQQRSNSIIINQSLAKQWNDVDIVIGQKVIDARKQIFTVIGVVKDIRLPNQASNIERLYKPSHVTRDFGFMIKLHQGSAITRTQIAELIRQLDSRFSIFTYDSLDSQYQTLLFNHVIILLTTGILTVIVLFLAGLGLFGVIDFNTRIRRFEIGTRLAIGAKRIDILKLVIVDNISAIIWGILASTMSLFALSFVFNEQVKSYINWKLLPIFLVTLALISIISFIACYLPLRQYINKPVQYSLRGAE